MNLIPDEPHLLDTSAVLLMMRHKVVAAPLASIPFVNFAEFLTGVARARDANRERDKVYSAFGLAAILYPESETLSIYGQVSADLQRLGLPIPTNDTWIAALALQWDLPILSSDAHFQRVPGLEFLAAA